MSQKRAREEDYRPQHRKKARSYTDTDIKLANTFESLASELKDVQIEAAVELIHYYNANDAPDKIFVRLVRGLCSSRKAARLGFFTAFVEILKGVPRGSQSVKDVLNRIEALTKPEGGVSKQEKKEHSIGRLAGLSAVVHSRLLFGQPLDVDVFDQFFNLSVGIMQRTKHLLEQCGRLWVDIVDVAAAEVCQEGIDRLLSHLHGKNLLYTSEGLAVWLHARRLAPSSILPSDIWHANDPLCASEKSRLSGVLEPETRSLTGEGQGSTALHGESLQLRTTGQPALGIARREPHFVFNIIIDELLHRHQGSKSVTRNGKHEPGATAESEFRRVVEIVDLLHFGPSRSAERKALGFKTFELVLAKTPALLLPCTLPPLMVDCLCAQVKIPAGYLHEAASSVLRQLSKRVECHDEPSVLRDVLLATSTSANPNRTSRGSPQAPILERARTLMESLFDCASSSSAKEAIPMLEKQLEEHVQKLQRGFNAETYSCARIVSDHLITLARTLVREDDDTSRDTRILIIKVLAKSLCSRQSSKLDSKSLVMLQSHLWRCLQDVVEGFGSHPEQQVVLVCVLSHAVESFTPSETLGLVDVDAAILQSVMTARKSLVKLRHDLDLQMKRTLEPVQGLWISTGFAILFSITLLRVYIEPSGMQDLIPLLKDIQVSFNEYERSSEEGAKVFLASVTDLILAYCPKTEGVFRVVAEQVFTSFTRNISTHDLEPLFDVVAQDENLSGQRELFKQSTDEEEEIDNGEEIDIEEVSDVELVEDHLHITRNTGASLPLDGTNTSSDTTDASADVSQDGSSTESDTEEEDQETSGAIDGNDAADEALNKSLGEILGTMAVEDVNRGRSSGEEDTSDSDADMSDNEMERLNIDVQLSSIFKQRQQQSANGHKPGESQKTQQKEAKRLMLMFKSRVLNLLGIHITANYASPDCLPILLPLCRLIGSTRNAPLAKKAGDLLEKYIKLCKKKQNGIPLAIDEDIAWSLLKAVHEEALLFKSKNHATACSRTSLFLARVLLVTARAQSTSDKTRVDRLVVELKARYDETKERRLELQSPLPDNFWENWTGWLDSMGLR